MSTNHIFLNEKSAEADPTEVLLLTGLAPYRYAKPTRKLETAEKVLSVLYNLRSQVPNTESTVYGYGQAR